MAEASLIGEGQKQHEEHDLRVVASWLKCDVADLSLELREESIDQFMPQVREMLASYDLFPKEAARTDRIERLLRKGAAPRPIYVERDDPHNFILEGRHRIVAFYRLGHKTVRACRVQAEGQDQRRRPSEAG